MESRPGQEEYPVTVPIAVAIAVPIAVIASGRRPTRCGDCRRRRLGGRGGCGGGGTERGLKDAVLVVVLCEVGLKT